MSTIQPDEATPLLRKTANPLPKFQLFILLWVQLAEPTTSLVIYPFINKVCTTVSILHRIYLPLCCACFQLIAELPITGGDEAKVGYYAGLIVSLTTCFSRSVVVLNIP